jgi:hypothetical protein
MQPTPFTIRAATADDRPALTRLAELDSRPPIVRPALIAEVRGAAAAAIGLADGRIVADPFTPTAALVEHLQLRAAALCGPPPRRRWRWSRIRWTQPQSVVTA